jgi:hypothetical protein
MADAPHDLRADTTLRADEQVAGRFHADIPEAWKVMYVFGGVSMYAALVPCTKRSTATTSSW